MQHSCFNVKCDLLKKLWTLTIQIKEEKESREYKFDDNTFRSIIEYAIDIFEGVELEALPNIQIKKIDDNSYEWVIRDAEFLQDGPVKIYYINRSTAFAVSRVYMQRMIDYLVALIIPQDNYDN